MKIDDRCLPYAEEMKTCGYCAEGEYLAVFGIKICELDATKLYLFKEQSHRGRVIVASKLHVSEITALSDEERNAFFADVNRVCMPFSIRQRSTMAPTATRGTTCISTLCRNMQATSSNGAESSQ